MKKTRTKHLWVLLLTLLLITLMSVLVSANTNQITVILDGEQLSFDVQPKNIDGRTMVPLRAIFEALGATVEWDGSTRTVTSTRGSTTIKMTIDSSDIYVNDTKITLDVPATIVEDKGESRTLVPVRAISEAFGCQVGWDGDRKIVSIINDSENHKMLYATKERSRSFAISEIDAQLSVGWYLDEALTVNSYLTDAKATEILQRKADEMVMGCAETVLRDRLKHPSSLEVLDEEIIDQDDYLRYIVKIRYSAQNAAGGYVTDYFYVMLKINSKLDGTFEYYIDNVLGFEYWYTDDDKKEFDWGIKPDDFSLDSVKNIESGESVSLRQIIAYPEKYKGKYVTIKEDLVVYSNDIKNKFLSVAQSTGENKYDYSSDLYIGIYYRKVNNIDECIELNPDYQKITVTGYVGVFSDTKSAYIDAFEITF